MTDLSCTYAPSDSHEKKYFDFLWDVANNRPPGSDPSGQGELGGAAAVGFLQRSGVDKGFLKQIWSFSTPGSTMNLQQFYVAMRFIAMIQSGEMPISKDRFNVLKKERLTLPKFSGIEIPPQAPVPAATHTATPNIAAAALYAITPQEHVTYHNLFVKYDANRDGFVSREEALPILHQSGLDPAAVEQIWSMADEDKDNRLTSKEFSVAFHIIVGVTKRGYPMPLTLPPGLHSFLVNAPAVPFVDGNSAPVHTPAQPVAPVVVGLAPLPITSAAPPLNTSFVPSSAPFPEPPVAQKISAAFDHMEPPVQQISTHKDETIDMEVMSTTDALKQVAKKAIEAHGQSIEANGRALSNMQQIKQKLATDRISLEASLSNSISAHNETNAKLQATNEEIVRLQQELHELRVKLDQSLKQQAGSQTQLSAAIMEKSELSKQINDTLNQLKQNNLEVHSFSDQIIETSQNLGSATSLNQQSRTHLSQVQQDAKSLSAENEVLRQILASVKSELNGSMNNRSVFAAKLKSVQVQLLEEQQTTTKLTKSINQEKQKVVELTGEKEQLIQKLKQVAIGAASEPLLSSAAAQSLSAKSVDFPDVDNFYEAPESHATNSIEIDGDPFDGLNDKDATAGFVKFDDEAQPILAAEEAEITDFASNDPFAESDAFSNPPTNNGSVGDSAFDNAFGDDVFPVASENSGLGSNTVADPFVSSDVTVKLEDDAFGGDAFAEFNPNESNPFEDVKVDTFSEFDAGVKKDAFDTFSAPTEFSAFGDTSAVENKSADVFFPSDNAADTKFDAFSGFDESSSANPFGESEPFTQPTDKSATSSVAPGFDTFDAFGPTAESAVAAVAGFDTAFDTAFDSNISSGFDTTAAFETSAAGFDSFGDSTFGTTSTDVKVEEDDPFAAFE